jgi:hypothetical protein
MKHSNKNLMDSLNNVIDLQIDAIHELLENSPVDGSTGKNIQDSILKRKEMVDQLVSLILLNGGKIDKRANITSTPHTIVGETEVSQSSRSSSNNTDDQIMRQYSAIIKDDGIPKHIRTVLSEHYKRMKSVWPFVCHTSH